MNGTRTSSASGAPQRIVSLLPSATEMICALGLADELCAITHCCDYPAEILSKPVIVHSALPVEEMSLAEIDSAVSRQLSSGASLYTVDEGMLRDISPTLIVTQDLCQVCAPAGNEVSRALKALDTTPEVLWMSPHSITDIHQNLRELGTATGREAEAESLIADGQSELARIRSISSQAQFTPKVFCAEWTDPLYCSGHWVPEMVEIAGGKDVLGHKWADSTRISWEQLQAADPDIVVVMACGFDCDRNREMARTLAGNPAARNLTAVRNHKVYAVDAGFFSRPGPRVVTGTRLLAHLLHPEFFPWHGPPAAYWRLPEGSVSEPRTLEQAHGSV